jgi:hypothetical protein
MRCQLNQQSFWRKIMRKSDTKTSSTDSAAATPFATIPVIPVHLRHRGVALPLKTIPPADMPLRPQIAQAPYEPVAVADSLLPSEEDHKGEHINPSFSTRFQKGVSGNLRGRPKGSRNTATIFNEESDTRITVTENGKTLRVTKRELVLKGVVNKAAKGEPKAVATYLKLDERYRPADPKENLSEAAQTKFLMEEDAAILAHYGIGVSCADDSQEKPLEPTTPV